MRIPVTLYAIMRELLPKEARGKTVLELPEGSTLADARACLNLPAAAVCAVNGQVERDDCRVLREGDTLGVFKAAGGG